MNKSILLLYATVTGNAEDVAKSVATFARKRGYEPTTTNVSDYQFELHAMEGRVLLIASTYGKGEPPPDAEYFFNWLRSQTSFKSRILYSIYALGDTSYDDFCGFGKALDEEFERLGATRVAKRSDNDLDYEAGLNNWLSEVFAGFRAMEVAAVAA